jgi:hypothetical protein
VELSKAIVVGEYTTDLRWTLFILPNVRTTLKQLTFTYAFYLGRPRPEIKRVLRDL